MSETDDQTRLISDLEKMLWPDERASTDPPPHTATVVKAARNFLENFK